MSYGAAAALQTAIYQHLLADSGVAAQVGTAVYDAVPAGQLPATYITLGPEDVRDRSDKSGAGSEHRFTISVITRTGGYRDAKLAAGAVSDALDGADITLSRGRLVGLWFTRALALRTGRAGGLRQIDLRFRARVEDN
ncbi:MAG: DUF3168 domain-containing protein [Pseudomonadota bacterium]